MTTSGTTAFNPALGSIVAYAFSRCGVRRTALIQEHFEDARMAANMVLADFANRGVNLWKVALVSQALTQGVATYPVDPSTVVMLDAYVSIPNGINGGTTDRLILPVSRTEYASYTNKSQQGAVTTFWNDRLLAPTVTLYQVPDGTQPTLNYYVLRQIQDAAFTNGQTVDVPYLWLKAFADALSVELAAIWAPDRLAFLQPMADKSYAFAADTGIETAQQYISPTISGYFRV